jgi:hypothetical protein
LACFNHIRRSLGLAPRTPILSAATEADTIGRALNVTVIHKPFAVSDLVRAIATTLGTN